MKTNQPAISFWRKVISDVTKGKYSETTLNSNTWHGTVQTFSVS